MTLWQLVFQEYRFQLIGLAIASLISALAGVAIIAYINSALIVADGDPCTLLWQFTALLILLFVLRFVSQYSLTVIGQKFVYEFRNNLIKRFMDTDIAIIEKLGNARVLASLSKDIDKIQAAFIDAPSFIQSSILVISAFVYLGYLAIDLLGAVLVLIISIALFGSLLVKQVYRHYKILRHTEDNLYKNFEDIIYGRKELSLNRHRAKLLYDEDYLVNADTIRRHVILGDTYHLTALNWSDMMLLGSIGMVFYLANVLQWADNITATTFAITILFLKSPLIQTIGVIPVFLEAHVSFKKVKQLKLDQTDDVRLNNNKVNFSVQSSPLNWQKNELREVYYQYLDKQGISSFGIGPINLTLNRGDIVFLIGGNGSGKSTFAKIITGLYRPNAGQILIDGKPIYNPEDFDHNENSKNAILVSNSDEVANNNSNSNRVDSNKANNILNNYSISTYRQLYSAIYTDLYLFKTIIGQRNTLSEVEQQLLQEWLVLLGMNDKLDIDANSKVLNDDLSQGQKKRLAMLLAVLEQRDLLLLDEWAADQDPQFRRIFYFDIIPKFKAMGKTLIVISHDDHYFEQADRLLQMKHGQLHELTGQERINASRDAVATVTSVEA